MSRCQHCGQGSLTKDINGPVCADCWEEGYYEAETPMNNETEAPELHSPYHDGSMQVDKDGGWVSAEDYAALSDAKDKRIEELGLQLLTAQDERDNAFLIVDENWVTHQEIVHAAAKVEKAEARVAELEAEQAEADRLLDECQGIILRYKINREELEAKLAKAVAFIKEISFRALSKEHEEDELWLIDKDNLTRSWDVDITKARATIAALKNTTATRG